MNRRGFLFSLAAPLIVRPSLEDIERLTWRRRLWPGYRSRSRNRIITAEEFADIALKVLRENLGRWEAEARRVNAEYAPFFEGSPRAPDHGLAHGGIKIAL